MTKRLDHEMVLSLLPDRNPWGHKGNFGRLLLLCGSKGYTGAAFFAAMGALRSGAGVVFLGVPESIYAIEAVKLNEPVIFPLPDAGGRLSAAAVPEILPRLPRMDAVLVGPGLEEKYGSGTMVWMIALTALVTGLVNFIFFPHTALLGASGVVFMMIVLSSFTAARKGEIPVTLILVVIFYLGGEIMDGLFKQDNVSQIAHIVGGLCGLVFGFTVRRGRR